MDIIKRFSILLLLTAFVIPVSAQEPTDLVVRVMAKDAKFIGTSMGGAFITVRNAETGELLAEGLTAGSTGDTQRLVVDSKRRYEQLYSEGSAKFETVLELSEPVFVTVKAVAPYAKKQAHVTSSTQLWLIPGKDITGNGLILEMPGFVVDVLSPQTHSRTSGREITIQANVVMMCGCPTSDGGLWDSSDYEIRALVKRDGETVNTVPLSFTGTSNLFSGTYETPDSGVYEIMVYAYDAKTGNTGLDKTTVIVE